jgi:AraC-like DNA-binding protein
MEKVTRKAYLKGSDQKLVVTFSVKVDEYVRSLGDEELGKISVRKIAEIFELNPSYLSSKYKKGKQMRLGDFIRDIKLERARGLLIQNKELKVWQISLIFGFEKTKYFSKIFKRKYNLLPKKLVEANKSKFFGP